MKDQKLLSVCLTYVNLILNSVISIFFTPFLISSLGVAEYGIYQLISSFAGYLIIMNFGVGTIITRNITRYITLGDKKGQENFLFLAMVITGVLLVLLGGVSIGMYFGIDPLYATKMTASELANAKHLYILMCFNIGFSLIVNSFSGIINAYEKFAVNNSFQILKYLLRIVTLVLLLNLGFKSFAIVLTDLLLTLFVLALDLIYCFKSLGIRIRFHFWDGVLLRTSMVFALSIFLQSIVSQVNNNLDRVILGAMTTTTVVAVYSISLTLYSMFASVTGAISSVFLPKATRLLTKGASPKAMTDLIIRPGRIQFMISCLFISGFVIFGRNFLLNWVGPRFQDAYLPTIILFVPLGIMTSQGVVDAVLDAMMKRLVRSVVLVFMAALNVLLSIFLVRHIGFIGAAIGTAASIFTGHILIMGIYYQRVIKLQMLRLYKEIYLRTALITLVLGTGAYLLLSSHSVGWIALMAECAAYTVIFALSMFFLGMTNEEKTYVKRKLRVRA